MRGSDELSGGRNVWFSNQWRHALELFGLEFDDNRVGWAVIGFGPTLPSYKSTSFPRAIREEFQENADVYRLKLLEVCSVRFCGYPNGVPCRFHAYSKKTKYQ